MTVIDDYLEGLDPAAKTELERLRAIALEMLPGAEEATAYGMPAIKSRGKSVIGFMANKHHIGIYPFSGHVIEKIPELRHHGQTKGGVHEPLNDLLPKAVIQKIIQARLDEIAQS